MALEKYHEMLNAAEEEMSRISDEEEEKVRVKVMFPDGSMHEIETLTMAEYRDAGGMDRVLWLMVKR